MGSFELGRTSRELGERFRTRIAGASERLLPSRREELPKNISGAGMPLRLPAGDARMRPLDFYNHLHVVIETGQSRHNPILPVKACGAEDKSTHT